MQMPVRSVEPLTPGAVGPAYGSFFISLRLANRACKRWLPSCFTKSTDTHHMRDATRIIPVCLLRGAVSVASSSRVSRV